MLGVSCLNKLDAATKGTQRFSNPQALSSTLAAFGMLQPQASGLWVTKSFSSLGLGI